MFQEMAIYSIEYEPDDPEMVKILESMKKAKDELEAYIKKSSE
jgi:formiminotetrahydrofolate cyclodeaminase